MISVVWTTIDARVWHNPGRSPTEAQSDRRLLNREIDKHLESLLELCAQQGIPVRVKRSRFAPVEVAEPWRACTQRTVTVYVENKTDVALLEILR